MIVGITGVTVLEETEVVVEASIAIAETIVEDMIGVTTEVAMIAEMTEVAMTDVMTVVAMIAAMIVVVAEVDMTVAIIMTDHGMVAMVVIEDMIGEEVVIVMNVDQKTDDPQIVMVRVKLLDFYGFFRS